MNAVANAGPLIALGKRGLIHLLHRLYDPLYVPDEVYVVTVGNSRLTVVSPGGSSTKEGG
jgi:hypothetical protein